MSKSKNFHSDEEKAEINVNSVFQKYDKGSSCNDHIAISPDCTQIVTLNTETYQLKLYKSDNLSKPRAISYDGFKKNDASSNWSLAVSDEFTLDDGVEVLIAVSCFDKYHLDDTNINIKSDATMIEHKENEASTWIISAAYQSRISSPINNVGGIVKFLDR